MLKVILKGKKEIRVGNGVEPVRRTKRIVTSLAEEVVQLVELLPSKLEVLSLIARTM